jgi:hypothetical protein
MSKFSAEGSTMKLESIHSCVKCGRAAQLTITHLYFEMAKFINNQVSAQDEQSTIRQSITQRPI